MATPYKLVEHRCTPGGICPHCGSDYGLIESVSGQNVLRCGNCGRGLYNPSKTETGEKPRTLQTTHKAIKPKTRTRIINRAAGRCETCGSRNLLTVGHVVSRNDGHRLGLSDEVINSDDNLICQCAECNAGQGKGTIPLAMYCSILKARAGL